MNFSEKLQFIMQITSTSNQNLADAIGMPPSTISLYRSGKRGIPRKDANLRKITEYFSHRFENAYQLEAFSDAIGINLQAREHDDAAIETLLYNWFKGTNYTVASQKAISIMDAISAPVNREQKYSVPKTLSPEGNFQENQTQLYFHRTGKKEALHAMYRHLLSLPEPSILYQQIDDDSSWIFRDPIFSNDIVHYVNQLEERGWKNIFLLPPTSSPSYYELLSMSIHRFQKGLSTPYFYPRMRDGLYRGLQFYVPGTIALISHGILGMIDNHITMLSSDPQVLESSKAAFASLMLDYRPAINEIGLTEFHTMLIEHLAVLPGTHMHRTPALSLETIPLELIQKIDSNKDNSFRPLHELIVDRSRLRMSQSPYYDICGLPSVEEIRSGKVPICYVGQNRNSSEYYTPELFILHLENILHLIETQPNYHFIPIEYDPNIRCALALNASVFGLMLRFDNARAYVIEDTGLRSVFYEYLSEYVDREEYKGSSRNHIKERIRRMIRELRK